MLYLTCTAITSVDLAHYGILRAKDWVSVNCGTIYSESSLSILKFLGLTSGKANNDGFFRA